MCITLYFCPAFAWYCGFVNEDICLFVVAIAKDKFTLVRPLPNPNLGTINESVKKADVAVQALPKESVNIVKPLQSEGSGTPNVIRRDVGIQGILGMLTCVVPK